MVFCFGVCIEFLYVETAVGMVLDRKNGTFQTGVIFTSCRKVSHKIFCVFFSFCIEFL